MGGIDVASVVASIISAYGSGMEVLHRLGGKKRKSSARLPRPWEEEEWAQESLTRRPVQIKHEYDENVVKFGRRFEVGDSTAHSTLAHTLLVLNTGLINLINQALSPDSQLKVTFQKTLYSLSETAAQDTIAALGQLKSRLSLASPSRIRLDLKESQRSNDRDSHHHSRKGSATSLSKAPKRPAPAPLLVRGGWVRTKSGSSVVSGTAARKASGQRGPMAEKAKEAKAEKHVRSKSDTAASSSSDSRNALHSRKRSDAEDSVVSEDTPGIEGRYAEELTSPQHHKSEGHPPFLRQRTDTNPQPQRQPSLLIVPADFFDFPSAPIQPERLIPPPRPPKIPLDSMSRLRPRPAHTNKARPTSTMTFMTASTKIGEIPEPKWHDEAVAGEASESRRPAYIIPPPLEVGEPKKKKGFRFWKRDCKRQEIAV